MAAQEIKYILEGDASGAVKAAKQAQDAVNNAKESLNKLHNQAKNVSGLKNYSKALITVRDSLSKNNPQLKTFNKLIAETKTEMKGMKTANAFDTSTINGLKQYKSALIESRNANAKSISALTSFNKRIEATNTKLKRLSSTGISNVGKSFQGLTARMDKVNTTFSKAPFAQAAPKIKKFASALERAKSAMKQNSFDTSSINGLKRYKRELIDQRDAVAKTDAAFASYNRRIQATTTELKRLSKTGISQVGKAFQGLQLRMDKTNTTFAKAPFSNATPQISRFTNVLGQSRTSLSNFEKTAGTANFAILGLTQGLQDLPFGFIGIQNNIPMVIRSFSQLRREEVELAGESGATGRAFKSLGSAIMGSGGLFLGVSVLTSGLTFLTQKYGSLGKAFDAIFGKSRKLSEFQREYNNALEKTNGSIKDQAQAMAGLYSSITGVVGIQGRAISKASEKLAKLKTLYGVATDVTRSPKERKKAAEELQKTFPETLGGLDKMSILSGQASTEVKKLTDNILDLAKAQSAFESIKNNYTKLGDATEKTTNLLDDYYKAQSKIDNFQGQRKRKVVGQTGLVVESNTNTTAFQKLVDSRDKALKNYREQLSAFDDISNKVDKSNEALTKQIKDLSVIMKDAESSGKNFNSTLSDFVPSEAFSEYTKKINDLKNELSEGIIDKDTFGSSQLQLTIKYLKDFISEGAMATSQYAQLKAIFEDLSEIDPLSHINAISGQVGFKLGSIRDNSKDIQGIFEQLSKDRKNTTFGIQYLGLTGGEALQQRINSITKSIQDLHDEGVKPVDFSMILGENGQLIPDEAGMRMQELIDKLRTLKEEYAGMQEENTNAFQKLNKNLQVAGKGMQTLFEGIFQGFVEGKSFVDVFVKAIERLIIKLAAAAAAAAVLSSATGGGFLGILGGLIGIPKLATGGFVSSPTVAMVGDAPGGEWVLNQGQMESLLTSRQPQVVRVEGEFVQRGRDLVAVVDNQSQVNEVL